mmetsp:Transcript_42775/g.124347  ORF Transcript_42775/g.124347 Transcript_42775/m.124347 type:complete len:318 (+) Transcript_42775:1520-2473(+)
MSFAARSRCCANCRSKKLLACTICCGWTSISSSEGCTSIFNLRCLASASAMGQAVLATRTSEISLCSLSRATSRSWTSKTSCAAVASSSSNCFSIGGMIWLRIRPLMSSTTSRTSSSGIFAEFPASKYCEAPSYALKRSDRRSNSLLSSASCSSFSLIVICTALSRGESVSFVGLWPTFCKSIRVAVNTRTSSRNSSRSRRSASDGDLACSAFSWAIARLRSAKAAAKYRMIAKRMLSMWLDEVNQRFAVSCIFAVSCLWVALDSAASSSKASSASASLGKSAVMSEHVACSVSTISVNKSFISPARSSCMKRSMSS